MVKVKSCVLTVAVTLWEGNPPEPEQVTVNVVFCAGVEADVVMIIVPDPVPPPVGMVMEGLLAVALGGNPVTEQFRVPLYPFTGVAVRV